MSDDRDLDTIIADAREELDTLRRNGAGLSVRRAGEILDSIAQATEEYRRFIPETEAQLRSGRSVEWLRAQHRVWMEQGHAQLRGRARYYRMCVVPHRPDLVAARAAGRRGASRVTS